VILLAALAGLLSALPSRLLTVPDGLLLRLLLSANTLLTTLTALLTTLVLPAWFCSFGFTTAPSLLPNQQPK
jgi:Mg2+/Co2+ transporter CorB